MFVHIGDSIASLWLISNDLSLLYFPYMQLNKGGYKMGQKDYAQNDYFNDKVRFSDICNGILFQGKEKTETQFFLLSFAFNIQKYHNRIAGKRIGMDLFKKEIA